MYLNIIKSKFQKGTAARNVAVLTMGTVVAQVLTVLSTPILSRLYTPSDFGLLAVFLSLSGICAIFVTLRYETAVLVPSCNSEAKALVSLAILIAIIFSLIFCAISVLISDDILQKLGFDSMRGWLPLVFLIAAAVAISAASQAWLNRQKEYGKMAVLRLVQSTLTLCLALGFGYMALSDGLIWAQVISLTTIALASLWICRSVFEVHQKRYLFQAAYDHQNSAKYLLPTSLMDTISLQLPLLLIVRWFGEDLAGQYSMAWRLLMLPMSLIGGSIAQVFLEKFARGAGGDGSLRKSLLVRTWRTLFFLGIGPTIIILAYGNEIFSLFLGTKWGDSGAIAQILAPMTLAMFVSSPTSGIYVILGLQKYSLLFGMLALIYRPLCLYWGFLSGDLFLGLKTLLVCEVVQIIFYQFIGWARTGNKIESILR